jgi:hypothetical protein
LTQAQLTALITPGKFLDWQFALPTRIDLNDLELASTCLNISRKSSSMLEAL